ncbi:MAG: response regulator [Myxococcota bacterium]|jgi:two-component system chemotaxis response regulator CheY
MRALIVDDSSAMRKIMGRILEKAGFEIDLATDGRNALSVLSEIPMPQVALVDWNMPEMNGLEFVQNVRANGTYDAMKIMMVTTETESEQMISALEAGANEYTMKPFTKEAILEKLRMLGFEV